MEFSSLLLSLSSGGVFPVPLDNFPPDPTFVRCDVSHGLFPHRTNCSLFHVCSFAVHQVYACLNGFFFHPLSQRCQEGNSPSIDCRTVREEISQWKFYPIDELIIGETAKENDERKSFQSMCERRGIFPDVFDCSLFHLCRSNGDHQVLRCPSGFHFDPKTSLCLRSQLVRTTFFSRRFDRKRRFDSS